MYHILYLEHRSLLIEHATEGHDKKKVSTL